MFLIIYKVKLDISSDLQLGELNTILSDFLTLLLSRANTTLSAFNGAISYQWTRKHSSESNIPEFSAVCTGDISLLQYSEESRWCKGLWVSVPRAGMITAGGLLQLYPAWHGLVTTQDQSVCFQSNPSHNYSQDWAAKYMFTRLLHSDKNPTICWLN